MAIRIPIITDFKNGDLKRATREIERFADKAMGQLKMIGVGAVAGLGLAVNEFAKFDDKMTQSLAIMGDVSDDMRTQMETVARDVAKSTTFSAEQAAESYFFLASAGLDAAASMAAMPQVASFAQAGMFDMARATDLLTDAQSALGLTVRDDAQANLLNMARVSDTLVKANTLANASVEQFSTALTTKAGPAMRAVGMDVEEGVAVLAAFADQGIKSELAGTNFAIVLRDLQTKAISNKDAFAEAGVAVFDATGEMRNMADIVADLENATTGMSDEQKKATFTMLGFSDKSMGALAALLGTSDAIRGYESELRKANGTTDEIANKQLESFSSQLKILWSQLQDVAIQVGSNLVPTLQDMVRYLNTDEGRRKMEQLATTLSKVAIAAAGLVSWLSDNLDLLAKITIAVGAVRIAWGVLVAAVAIYNAATIGAVAVTNALKLAIASTGIGLAIIAAGTLVTSLMNAGDSASDAVAPTDDYRLSLLALETQANNTTTALGQVALVNGRIPSAGFGEDRKPQNPQPGQVYTWFNYSDRDNPDLAIWWQQTWTGTEWTKPKRMTYTPTTGGSGGTGRTAAQTLADNRAALVQEISGYNENLLSLSRLSDTILSQYEQNVVDTLARARDTIAKALEQDVITARGARALNRVANWTEKALGKIARMRADLANQYDDLTSKLFSAKALRESTAADIESLANLAELSKLTRTTVDATGQTIETTTQSSAQLISNLKSVVEGVKGFRDNMKKLREMGLDPKLYEQIISSGMEAGGATAKAIIDGGPEAVSEINKLFGEIETVGNEIGLGVSEVMFDGGESAIQGLIDGLKAQDDALADQAERVAEIFFDALQGKIDGTVIDLDPILDQLRDLYAGIGLDLGDLPTPGTTTPTAPSVDTSALEKEIARLEAAIKEQEAILSSGTAGPGARAWAETKLASYLEQLATAQAALAAAVASTPVFQFDPSLIPADGAGMEFSTQSAGATYNINVTADTRAGGIAAGEAVVGALKTYALAGGPVSGLLGQAQVTL